MFQMQVDNEIKLRMLSARDADSLFEITMQSKEYLKEWLPWLDDIRSPSDSMAFIKNSFLIYNNRQGITAGIFLNEQLVGVISFNKLDFNNKIGYIGYWLAKHHQGKGIMTKSVAALVSYGFEELSLNRIDIRAASGNWPSRAIAERLGFRKEGCLRQAEWLYNRHVDHVIYGLLKEEWKSKQAYG